MAIPPQDIAVLRSALSRAARSASAPEVAAFAARLKDASLASIRQKLASRAIGRTWKRDLAEAEIERRSVAERGAEAQPSAGRAAGAATKRIVLLWKKWAAGALIAVSTVVIIYFVLVISKT